MGIQNCCKTKGVVKMVPYQGTSMLCLMSSHYVELLGSIGEIAALKSS
jgi:hypothetical protein